MLLNAQKVKRYTFLASLLFLTIVLIFLVAKTITHADNPTTLTGCLKDNTGIMYDIAQSTDPLNPCRTGDSEVALNTTGTTTRIITANMVGWNSDTVMSMGGGIRTSATAVGTGVRYTFAIPFDYAGGDLRIREWLYVNEPGTAKMVREIRKSASSDGAETMLEDGENNDLTHGSSGRFTRVYTIDEEDVEPGDLFFVALTRDGSDGSDTMGLMDILGVAVEYTANQ